MGFFCGLENEIRPPSIPPWKRGEGRKTVQLLALRYDRKACRKNARLANSEATVAKTVKPIIRQSNRRTITFEGTFATSKIGRMNVKTKPSGATFVLSKICLG